MSPLSDELDDRIRDLEAERLRPGPDPLPPPGPKPLSLEQREANRARLENELADAHREKLADAQQQHREEDQIVDEVAVERAADGEHLPLTQVERQAAAELILARGGTLTQVSRLLRVSGATARAMAEKAQKETK